jgi:transcriptional regulator NrdR family protein
MLHHYVFIKYRRGTPEAHIAEFGRRTLALRAAIAEIEHVEIGRDILHEARSWDLVLIMRFASVEALQRYQPHPEHVKVKEFNTPQVEAVASVDFTEAWQ